ncbi:MAG: hypothetical protein O2960_11505 [Verrucomicrobia bacterium]|nr:hypothetical protein [Verrucomicrobiota bacterium]
MFQIALVYFLSAYEIPTREWPRRQFDVRVAPESADRSNPRELLLFSDPTLFALVHPKNFSGSAWLRAPEFPYEPTNRIQPPALLSPRAADFGAEFSEYVTSAFPRFLEKPERPSPQVFAAELPAPLAFNRADLRIEGDLKDRRLVFSPPLPAPERGALLRNCLVGVLVDARGETFSPVLKVSSGSSAVDQSALEFAASARFSPISKNEPELPGDDASFTYGTLVFQWFANRPQRSQVVPDR